jgi:hypothetical protein
MWSDDFTSSDHFSAAFESRNWSDDEKSSDHIKPIFVKQEIAATNQKQLTTYFTRNAA